MGWLASMRPGAERFRFERVRRGFGVYALTFAGAGRIKIGFSSDFANRIDSLSTGAPHPIVALAFIAGDAQTEKHFHRKLSEHRRHLEWFDDNADVRAFLVREAKRRGGVWNVSEGS